MTEPVPTRPIHAALAVILSSVLTLVAVEVGLRVFDTDRYYVWPPGLTHTVQSLPEVTPGIHGETTFSTNSYGIRGREFSEDDDYRILAMGGSTTESILVDDSEAWPHLLEQELDRRFPTARVWVGSVGRSGHSSRDHLLQTERLPTQYPDIDAVVVLVGVNDLLIRFNRDTAYVPFAQAPPEYHQGLLLHAFSSVPDLARDDYPFYKRTKLWQTVRRVAMRWQLRPPGQNQREGAGYLVGARARRQRAGRRDSLPDLSSALADYGRTLHAIVTTLEAEGIKPILMTQPYMWRTDLPAELESLLWFGRVGSSAVRPEEIFYDAGALAEAMRLHNEVLRGVCREREIACVDLAAALPRDTTVFYDDVHFNEHGSRRVTEVVAAALAHDPDIRAVLTR